MFCCLICLLIFEAGGAQPVGGVRQEQHFETLTIGTQTYSNVTVTTQNKNYVFLLHSGGMINIKVAELPVETREILGYAKKAPAPTAATWAKQTLEKQTLVDLQKPEVKEFQKRLSADQLRLKQISSALSIWVVVGILAFALLIYLFTSYCGKLICKKAGHDPGVLIWLPVLQMIPLLRAAKMSPAWLLALLIPLLNIVAQIIWCVKITQARGKTFWTAIFLILPVTSFFAFLYLAFSDGAGSDDDKRVEIMTLETS